jgi:hypothetical protein
VGVDDQCAGMGNHLTVEKGNPLLVLVCHV